MCGNLQNCGFLAFTPAGKQRLKPGMDIKLMTDANGGERKTCLG